MCTIKERRHTMTKQQIIDMLNKTDDYRALGFTPIADDGRNTLIGRKQGRGQMLLNRFENWHDEREDGERAVYTDDVSGWDSGR
jgi:hypothetical protein